MSWLLIAGLAYAFLDLVLGFCLKRCVLPGLKCSACLRHEYYQKLENK